MASSLPPQTIPPRGPRRGNANIATAGYSGSNASVCDPVTPSCPIGAHLLVANFDRRPPLRCGVNHVSDAMPHPQPVSQEVPRHARLRYATAMAAPTTTAPEPMATTMADRQGATPPTWLGRSWWSLLRDVFGGLRQNRDKFVQLFLLIAAYVWPPMVRRRVERLKTLGHIDVVPTVSQLLVAARDQMLLNAFAETRIFYDAQGIPWNFHNMRRFISGPATVLDPTGFHSPKQTLQHHILQTFHRHPHYDLVLLRAHENGLEEIQQQAQQILDGTHPHQRALTSLIEDGSYHARVGRDVAEFVKDPYVPPRQPPAGLVTDPHLMLGMEQFKDVRGYTNYASRLKVGGFGAFYAWFVVGFDATIGRLIRVKLMPKQVTFEACDPALLAKYYPKT